MKKVLGTMAVGVVGAYHIIRGLVALESDTALIDPGGPGRHSAPVTPSQSILIGVIILLGTAYWLWKTKPKKTKEEG